ncbi:MAG: flagellar biosynthetic protein FliO [Lachnospiraceae bacterium]|nr:flagellar biosynthetic protein FliO [Lachnospiraceae bacterium]
MAEALWSGKVFLVGNSMGKNILELIVLLGIFVLVLAACIVTTRFVAGHQMQRGKNSNFKPLETYQITQNRYLHLVQVGTRYLVVSVTKENINLIAELKEEEIVVKPEKTGLQRSFKEILSEFKVKVDKHDDAQK